MLVCRRCYTLLSGHSPHSVRPTLLAHFLLAWYVNISKQYVWNKWPSASFQFTNPFLKPQTKPNPFFDPRFLLKNHMVVAHMVLKWHLYRFFFQDTIYNTFYFDGHLIHYPTPQLRSLALKLLAIFAFWRRETILPRTEGGRFTIAEFMAT